jgi:hypothetical protein
MNSGTIFEAGQSLSDQISEHVVSIFTSEVSSAVRASEKVFSFETGDDGLAFNDDSAMIAWLLHCQEPVENRNIVCKVQRRKLAHQQIVLCLHVAAALFSFGRRGLSLWGIPVCLGTPYRFPHSSKQRFLPVLSPEPQLIEYR